jgi:lysophospholipase L1-like esterase
MPHSLSVAVARRREVRIGLVCGSCAGVVAWLVGWRALVAPTVLIASLVVCGGAFWLSRRRERRRWWQRHQEFIEIARAGEARVVCLGDSITSGWRADPVRPLWDAHLAPLGAVNFGMPGDLTHQLLWRVQHGELDGLDPVAVVLLIGANDVAALAEPREIAAMVGAILDVIRRKLPRTIVLLCGILPQGSIRSRARAVITEANRLLATLHDDRVVFWQDLGDSFLEPDGRISPDLMPDGLHPSPAGYEIWARALSAFLRPRLDRASEQSTRAATQ